MGIFPKNDYVYAPKEGAPAVTYTITGEVVRVKSTVDNVGYKNKGNVDAGYFDTVEVDGEKTLKISTWVLYFALKKVNPEVGDEIEIAHPKKGEYIITKK